MKLWDPLAFREMTALLGDPVMRGRGVRRGDGRPVLLVPGFLSGDWSLRVLHNWLQRVGYESHLSGIQFNVQHSEHLVAGLRTRLVAIRKGSGSRVSVVGHSRGGVLAKVLSSREPDCSRTAARRVRRPATRCSECCTLNWMPERCDS